MCIRDRWWVIFWLLHCEVSDRFCVVSREPFWEVRIFFRFVKFHLNWFTFSLMTWLSAFCPDPFHFSNFQPVSLHHKRHWVGICSWSPPGHPLAGHPFKINVALIMKISPVAFICSKWSPCNCCKHSIELLRWSPKGPLNRQTHEKALWLGSDDIWGWKEVLFTAGQCFHPPGHSSNMRLCLADQRQKFGWNCYQ